MALSAGSVEIRLFAELARLQSDMKKANRVVEDGMGGIKKTVRGATQIFNGLAGAFGAAQIVKLADDYKRFDSQLKLSTNTLQDYEKSYANVIRIGRTAQSDIGAIGVLYARLNNNLRDFNVTQEQVSDVTETISLALRVNNATVQETNSVMLQLSQSFGSGKINGQEFLAVAEGAPALLRQLAKSIGVTYGELKEMSAQGKLTREVMLKAWNDPEYLAGLRQQVKEVGTITSAITVLMNNLKQYIGETDKATGSSRAIAGAIKLIADNINILVTGALAYGIGQFIKWTNVQMASLRAIEANNAAKIIAAKVELSLAQAAYNSGAAVTKQTAAMANNAAATTMATSNAGRLAAAQAGLAAATNTTAIAVGKLRGLFMAFGGWIGVAVTAVILFGDELVKWVKKTAGFTPALAEMRQEMERINELKKAGISSQDPMANEKKTVSDLNVRLKEAVRLRDLYSKVAQQGSLRGTKLTLGEMASLGFGGAKNAAAAAEAQANIVKNIQFDLAKANDTVKATNVGLSESYVKLSEKLVTAKERAAEYAANQKLIRDELAKGTITKAEAQAKLAVLAEQYNKSTGALKANKAAMKEAAKEAKDLLEIERELAEFQLAQYQARNAAVISNDDLQAQIEANEKQIKIAVIGEEAYRALEVARLEDALATMKQTVAVGELNGLSGEALEFAQQNIQALEEQVALKRKLNEQEKTLDAVNKQNKSVIGEQAEGYKDLIRAVEGFGRRASQVFTDFVFGAKGSFADMANDFAKNITQMILQVQVFDPLMKSIMGTSGGGGFLGSVFGSGGGADLAPSASYGGIAGMDASVGGGFLDTIKSFLPSFAVGSRYIPRDMLANLHEGERVLTKNENKDYNKPKSETSGGLGNVIMNFTVNGQTDRHSQQQIGAAAYTGISRAAKRNL